MTKLVTVLETLVTMSHTLSPAKVKEPARGWEAAIETTIVAGCRTRQRAARSKISEREGAAATVHCQGRRRADLVQWHSDRHGDRRTSVTGD